MYINMDGLEIMVRVRREELLQQSTFGPTAERSQGFRWFRRSLIRLGGVLVTAGMTLEKLGVDREVYHLSTTASR
jgi:hypothetical protein